MQLTAFGHNVKVYRSQEEFHEDQGEGSTRFAPVCFIPTGTFSLGSTPRAFPEAIAFMNGIVVESSTFRNTHTGLPFHWALVRLPIGTVDVVLDASDVDRAPDVGGVVSGEFWLAGKLGAYPHRPVPWYRRIFGAFA